MTIATTSMPDSAVAPAKAALPPMVAIAIYAVMVLAGDHLLRDPDTYWQITLGNWIIDQRAVPYVDPFSWTMRGAPWISTQWLAQVTFAISQRVFGWGGPVVLAAAALAAAFGLMTRFIGRSLATIPTLVLAGTAFAISIPHLWARPHVLAMPVMVLFVGGLVTALDRRSAPPLLLLPLMTLWANLHGGFVLGIALIAPFGIGAVLASPHNEQGRLLGRWGLFGVLALGAACLTPYGWDSILASRRILNLGKALALISEWRAANFGDSGPLEIAVMCGFGLALWRGFRLSAIRSALVTGLVFLALSHTRNAEVLALLAPLVLARPLSEHLHKVVPTAPTMSRTTLAGLLLILLAGTIALLATRHYQPNMETSPVAAARVLKERGIARVLNDYDFGGYLIAAGIPPYIDGRTELYGEDFMVAHNNFSGMLDPDDFFRLIADDRVEATLLRPQSAATKVLDHLDGWNRIYSDAIAVVHVRDANARALQQPRLRPAID